MASPIAFHFAATALVIASCSQIAYAASAALMRDGSSVVIATFEGELQLWKRGDTAPKWSIKTKGTGDDLRSSIASVAVLADDRILIVERHGKIVTVSSDGKLLSTVQPFYGYVRLKTDTAGLADWSKNVDHFSSTSAAFITQDARYIYLVPDEWSIVVKALLHDVLEQKESVMTMSDSLVFKFKGDNLVISTRTDPPSLQSQGHWATADHYHPSALAACGNGIIVGSKEGYVEFISEESNDRRLRQVNDQKADYRNILAAGCLDDKRAYTVSLDTGYGQIQIWDLSKRIATSWAGLGTNGHPGMAFDAVASRTGTKLLSLGDFDVRLWAIEDKKLSLISKYYLGPGPKDPQLFSAVSLGSGDFVFSDGQRLWLIPSDGGEKRVYAGQPLK